jgi:lysophospholipase L1-like esterase
MPTHRGRSGLRWHAATALLALIALYAPTTPADEVGIVSDPCGGVPTEPGPRHRASADVYGAWMGDWLRQDWGQRCRYARENALLPPAGPARVVFIGDSITEGWVTGDPGLFTNDRIGRGISGQTTEQMLVRFPSDALALKPRVVHLMAGTNDIAGNRGPTTLDWLERSIEAMVTLARHDGAIVILASIPPADHFGWIPSIHPAETIATANRALKAYAVREGLVWVDYYAVLADEHGGLRKEYSDDGVHPNPRGYAAMRDSAERAIATALRQAPTAPSGDARPDTPR